MISALGLSPEMCIPRSLKVHPGKEARALHPKDRDEDVGNKDEEDDDGGAVVEAVQALVVGLVVEVSPSYGKM